MSLPAPKPAATVILVRDGDQGVEVFMMERSAHGSFGGLHVFPGGKVDPADGDARAFALCGGPTPGAANGILNLPYGGLAYWVAALRECFEEAGLLLACRDDGTLVEMRDPELRDRMARDRDQLNAGEKGTLERLCEREHFRLATDRLAYVAHWITPLGAPARYNTRFFVALAPEDQEALHDGHETVQSQWIRPQDALQRYRDGDMPMISPTLRSLQALCGYEWARLLVEAKLAVDPRSIPTILPEMVNRDAALEEMVERIVIVG